MSDTPVEFRPKSRSEQLVEARHGASVTDLLTRLYVEQGMSQAEVAVALGVSRDAVHDWMKRCGIPTRDRRALAGENAA